MSESFVKSVVRVGVFPGNKPGFFGVVTEWGQNTAMVRRFASDGADEHISVPRATVSIQMLPGAGPQSVLFNHLTSKDEHLATLSRPEVIVTLAERTKLLTHREKMEAVILADVVRPITLALMEKIKNPELRLWVLIDPRVSDLALHMAETASKAELCNASIRMYGECVNDNVQHPHCFTRLNTFLDSLRFEPAELERFFATVTVAPGSEDVHNTWVRCMTTGLALTYCRYLQRTGGSLPARLHVLDVHLPRTEEVRKVPLTPELLSGILTDDAPIEVIQMVRYGMTRDAAVRFLTSSDARVNLVMRLTALLFLSKQAFFDRCLLELRTVMSPMVAQAVITAGDAHANHDVFAYGVNKLRVEFQNQASQPPSE